MIILFNESTRSWSNNELNDKTGAFFKRKDSPVFDMHCFIRAMKHLIPSNDVLSKLIKMKEPVILNNALTSLIYGKKDFNPFIIENKRVDNNTDIVLVTLNIGKRMLVNISKDFICLLENYSLDGELTFIAALNNKDKPLEIRIYDKHTKSDMIYTFSIVENNVGGITEVNGEEIEVTNKVRELLFSKKIVESKNGDKYTPFIVSNFRPNRPTHTIFTLRSEKNQLHQLHSKYSNETAFNIVEFNNMELPSIIEKIKGERFSAVTLFIDSEYLNNRAKKFYSKALSQLEHNFKLFFIMLNNGKILKLKY